MQSSSSSRRSGPTSGPRICGLRSTSTRGAAAVSADAEAALKNFLSRILVVLLGAPVVLGGIWLGGWWLFALVLAGALVALHEFYAMARPLRPLVLAGYGGAVAMLVGPELGGGGGVGGGVRPGVGVACPRRLGGVRGAGGAAAGGP